jgi:hypothetical protein
MSSPSDYTTLAVIKALMNITSTNATDDEVLENSIDQASRMIDNITGRTFYARTETHYYDTPNSLDLIIRDDDLLSITTLTNGDGTVISSANYVFLPQNRSPKFGIRLKSGLALWYESTYGSQGAITVAGTWGYSAVAPTDIEKACQEIVVQAYHRREGQNTTGFVTITAAGVVITPDGVPASAMAVLRRYIKRF